MLNQFEIYLTIVDEQVRLANEIPHGPVEEKLLMACSRLSDAIRSLAKRQASTRPLAAEGEVMPTDSGTKLADTREQHARAVTSPAGDTVLAGGSYTNAIARSYAAAMEDYDNRVKMEHSAEPQAPLLDRATAGYVAMVQPNEQPSCHVCGAMMTPIGYKCKSCGLSTLPSEPEAKETTMQEQICMHCRLPESQHPNSKTSNFGYPHVFEAIRSTPKEDQARQAREFYVSRMKTSDHGLNDAVYQWMAAYGVEIEKQWREWGTVEIAARNPNVSEYYKHWENRTLVAESACERMGKALTEAQDHEDELEQQLATAQEEAEKAYAEASASNDVLFDSHNLMDSLNIPLNESDGQGGSTFLCLESRIKLALGVARTEERQRVQPLLEQVKLVVKAFHAQPKHGSPEDKAMIEQMERIAQAIEAGTEGESSGSDQRS